MRPGGENTARGPNETSCLPQTMRKQPWFERQREENFLAGQAEMTPADLTNRRTHEANHNGKPLATLLAGFRQARASLVGRLETVNDGALTHTALHPRLRVPMNLVDHAFFVAEHDDYHLARMTELLREFGGA